MLVYDMFTHVSVVRKSRKKENEEYESTRRLDEINSTIYSFIDKNLRTLIIYVNRLVKRDGWRSISRYSNRFQQYNERWTRGIWFSIAHALLETSFLLANTFHSIGYLSILMQWNSQFVFVTILRNSIINRFFTAFTFWLFCSLQAKMCPQNIEMFCVRIFSVQKTKFRRSILVETYQHSKPDISWLKVVS